MRELAKRLHRPMAVAVTGGAVAHTAVAGTFHFLDFVASWRVVTEVLSGLEASGGIVLVVTVALGAATVVAWVRKNRHAAATEEKAS